MLGMKAMRTVFPWPPPQLHLEDGAPGPFRLGLDGPRVEHGTVEWNGSAFPSTVSIPQGAGRGGSVPDSLVEDALQISLRQGRTLEVLVRPDLLGAQQGLVVRDGLHPLLSERLERGGVLSQIELGPDEDDGDVGCMVVDLGVPLLSAVNTLQPFPPSPDTGAEAPHLRLDVVEGRRADDGEADEENVGLGI